MIKVEIVLFFFWFLVFLTWTLIGSFPFPFPLNPKFSELLFIWTVLDSMSFSATTKTSTFTNTNTIVVRTIISPMFHITTEITTSIFVFILVEVSLLFGFILIPVLKLIFNPDLFGIHEFSIQSKIESPFTIYHIIHISHHIFTFTPYIHIHITHHTIVSLHTNIAYSVFQSYSSYKLLF